MQTARQRAREAQHFATVRRAAYAYAIKLRKIARHVGEIINAFPVGDPRVTDEVQRHLNNYAQIITPWARATAARMIAEVSRRDATAWRKTALTIGRNLRTELAEGDLGDDVRAILDGQVALITSIPIEAGQRVRNLTYEFASGGRRYDEIAKMIRDTTGVTVSRANLIARTEVAATSSAITQARAEVIGSTHYVWQTVQDMSVRPAHKRLNGKVFAWDDPPVAEENGTRHHPGRFPNCRCFAEPIIPAVIE